MGVKGWGFSGDAMMVGDDFEKQLNFECVLIHYSRLMEEGSFHDGRYLSIVLQWRIKV